MANQRESNLKEETNGIAKDKNMGPGPKSGNTQAKSGSSISKTIENLNIFKNQAIGEQAKGYIILAVSALLFLYSTFGLLKPLFDFIFAVSSIGFALYGANKANLLDTLQKAWNYLRSKF